MANTVNMNALPLKRRDVKVIMNDELGQKWEEAVVDLLTQSLPQKLCITLQIKILIAIKVNKLIFIVCHSLCAVQLIMCHMVTYR
jgi:hypothetical protein